MAATGNRIRYAIALAISIALLAALLFLLDVEQLLASLEQVDLAWFAIAFGVMPAFFLTKVYKWHYLVRTRAGVPFGDSLTSFLAGISFSLVTPARTGELSRVAYLPVRDRHVYTGLVALDKIFDLLCIIMLSCLGSVAILGHWATLLFILTIVAILLLVFNLSRLSRYVDRHPKLSGNRFFVSLGEMMALKPRQILYSISLTLLGFVLLLAQCYCLVRAFVPVSPEAILFSYPLTVLTNILPFTVSGLGLREGTAVLLLARFGVPGPAAFNATFLLFFINTFIPAIIGAGIIFLRHLSACGDSATGVRQGE
ncbi:MAG: hypothetical protein A4E28_03128 [Methanocella sp. PtaU1.Bin125]|nr:MAG: hypothetical protein A4E28_03128 [Methanocella sp. PtaU1.Bin125]